MANIITPRPRYGSTALRPGWEELPQHVHHLVSLHLGGEVTAEPSAGSGFTRGFAAVVHGTAGAQYQLDAALAALSGLFLVSGAQPPPDFASPFLRQHQTWIGEAALRWLADRRGWSF